MAIRRLHVKSNSAPPGRLKLPGHGTSDEQFLAIEEMKEHAAESGDRFQQLTMKAKQQKEDSKNVRVRQQWIAERAVLFQERKNCERELREQMEKTEELLGSTTFEPFCVAFAAVLKEERNAATDTSDCSSATMISIMSLRARVKAHKHRESRTKEELAIQQSIEQFKVYLTEEQRNWSEAGCSAVDGMSKMIAQLGVEFSTTSTNVDSIRPASSSGGGLQTIDDAEHNADLQFSQHCATYAGVSGQVTGLFRAAVSDCCRRARSSLPIVNVEVPGEVSSEDVERISNLARAYDPSRHKNLFGKTNEQLLERIAHDMPHVSSTNARQAVRAISELAAHNRRRGLIFRKLDEDVRHYLQCHEDALRAERMLLDAAEDQRARLQRDQEKRSAAAAVLEKMRSEYDEKMTAEMKEKSEAEEALMRKDEKRRAKLQEEFEDRLKKLADHMSEKAEIDKREKQISEELQRQEEAELAMRRRHNAQRVDARMTECENRINELKLQRLLVADEKEKKQEALNHFFATVTEKLGVEKDPSRVLQPTVSSGQDAGYVPLREAAQHKMTGFTVEKLMQDPRFKLHQALLSAGLHNTAYGREVITRHHYVAPANVTSLANPLKGAF